MGTNILGKYNLPGSKSILIGNGDLLWLINYDAPSMNHKKDSPTVHFREVLHFHQFWPSILALTHIFHFRISIESINNESFHMSHLIWISRRDRFIKSVNCILNAAVYWRTNQNCLLIIQSQSPDLWQVFRNKKTDSLFVR